MVAVLMHTLLKSHTRQLRLVQLNFKQQNSKYLYEWSNDSTLFYQKQKKVAYDVVKCFHDPNNGW